MIRFGGHVVVSFVRSGQRKRNNGPRRADLESEM